MSLQVSPYIAGKDLLKHKSKYALGLPKNSK